MLSPKAALRALHDPPFEMERNDPDEAVPISPWYAVLNGESVSVTAGVAATIHAKTPGESEHCRIESCRRDNDHGITREVNYTVRELAAS